MVKTKRFLMSDTRIRNRKGNHVVDSSIDDVDDDDINSSIDDVDDDDINSSIDDDIIVIKTNLVKSSKHNKNLTNNTSNNPNGDT